MGGGAIFSLWVIFGVLLDVVAAQQTQPPSQCVFQCLNRFTATADRIIGGSHGGGTGTGGVSWQNLLHMSNNGLRPRTEQEMKRSFDEMCSGFRSMKRCTSQCKEIWLRDSVVSGFASIQYVCEDRYQEFITHLPCLAANERRVVERCSHETNQTAAAIAALESTVNQNDVPKMTATLAALCRNTSQIVDCLTPATKELCGKRPAGILRRLVTLGFRSIEQMYRRMKIEHKLPEECANLAHAFADDDIEEQNLDESDKFENAPSFARPRTYATAPPAPIRSEHPMINRVHDGGNQLHRQSGAVSWTKNRFGWNLKFLSVISVLAQLRYTSF